MKKIYLSIFIAGTLLLSFAGCSSKDTKAPSETLIAPHSTQTQTTEETTIPFEETTVEAVVETVVETEVSEEYSEAPAPQAEELQAVMTAPFKTDSTAYCVLAEDGTVMLEKNMYSALKPASITKVLTSLVVLENTDLSAQVCVSQRAVQNIDVMSSGTDPLFKPGEMFTVQDLLYALLLSSSNAAGNILAEHVSGSTDAFAELMNEKCAALGLTHSHFENAHGLDSDNHFTCAYDMAVITREAAHNPALLSIMSAPEYTLPETEYQGPRYVRSGYRFINGVDSLEGAFAGKPGWTVGAQGTLVNVIERNGVRYYAAVMNSDENYHYTDTKNLINYVYDQNTVPQTELCNVFVADETPGLLRLNYSAIGNIVSSRVVYWFTAYGTENAVFMDATPAEYMSCDLPLSEPGTYTIQLFVTGADGQEVGTQMQVLYTGSLKGSNVEIPWNEAMYSLNNRGFLQTGIVEFPHHSVYTDTLGRYMVNCFTPDAMYYAGPDGKLVTGWQNIDGCSYYFQADGRKAIGTYVVDGETHYFDENGVLIY